MRTLTDHIVNPTNEDIVIRVIDEPGAGGANHIYDMILRTNDGAKVSRLEFQNGPIQESGVNGTTHEALLAILIDRLRGFQNGNYKCRENAIALTHLEDALLWLNKRTRDRMARNVEGTHQL